MNKLKLNIDFTYCSGNRCDKSYECKRFIDRYKVESECLWYVSSSVCITNNYSCFVKLKSNKIK